MADEHGVKRPRVAASLAEAIELRESRRAARRHGADPRQRRWPYHLEVDAIGRNA
jgi:hypothetical protein